MQVWGRQVLQIKGRASAKALRLTAESGNSKKLIWPQQRVLGVRGGRQSRSEAAWLGKD